MWRLHFRLHFPADCSKRERGGGASKKDNLTRTLKFQLNVHCWSLITQYSCQEREQERKETRIETVVLLQQLHCCVKMERMSQSFGGGGLDEIPLETIEKRGVNITLILSVIKSPSFQQSVVKLKKNMFTCIKTQRKTENAYIQINTSKYGSLHSTTQVSIWTLIAPSLRF